MKILDKAKDIIELKDVKIGQTFCYNKEIFIAVDIGIYLKMINGDLMTYSDLPLKEKTRVQIVECNFDC